MQYITFEAFKKFFLAWMNKKFEFLASLYFLQVKNNKNKTQKSEAKNLASSI
jgi:hypothetical protein